MNAQRGAVLIESAFVLLFLLAIAYGSVQLGMIGLQQITVDSGAYTAAHQQSLLGNNPQKYISGMKLAKDANPQLNGPNINAPAPVEGEPPAIGTGDPAAASALGAYDVSNSNGRHGGVSMILPAQTIATITHSSLASIALNDLTQFSVSGLAIEPSYRLINGHGDVSGSNFDTDQAFATASDPINNGNNAPPYFIGFNYMLSCPFSKTAWTQCPSTFFAGLGSAEYLDANNWSRAVNGVMPAQQAVFWEAGLHQDKFAEIALALTANQANPATEDADDQAALDPTNPAGANMSCVLSFDNDRLGSYAVGQTKIGQFPLTPQGGPMCTEP